MTLTASGPTGTTSGAAGSPLDLGPATALACRACGHRLALAAEFACPQCFGPL
jgi:threonine synthase